LHAKDKEVTLAGSPRCQEDGNRARVSSRLMRLPRHRPCPEAVRTIHSGDPANKNKTAFTRRPSGRHSSFCQRRPERIGATWSVICQQDIGAMPRDAQRRLFDWLDPWITSLRAAVQAECSARGCTVGPPRRTAARRYVLFDLCFSHSPIEDRRASGLRVGADDGTYDRTLTTTRRFCARPARVLFGATGFASP
jgi:hypothetical protein